MRNLKKFTKKRLLFYGIFQIKIKNILDFFKQFMYNLYVILLTNNSLLRLRRGQSPKGGVKYGKLTVRL